MSAEGASAEIPVQLEVLTIELMQPPGISWGMYDYVRTYSDAPDALKEKWRDQAEHGMTSVGLCGNLGAEMEMRGGQVVVAWTGETDLERAMAAYQAAGFTEPVQWLMGRDVSKFSAAQGAMASMHMRTLTRASFARCWSALRGRAGRRSSSSRWMRPSSTARASSR